MSIRHNENVIVPVPNDPFKNCKLGRGIYAEVLTSIVDKYSEGFVLAINNEWGTGKTTFVKMWQQHMEDRGFRTLYYNAWENDFEQDVMVAIISELETILKKNDGKAKEIFAKVVKKAAPLAKSLAVSFIKTQIEKQFGGEFAKEAFKLTTEEAAKELQTQIDSYNSRKNSITEFKESLTEFVNKSTDDKPVVFIIDEMDRCRPNYAVEVLEQIKHLFNVPGIVFVLAIDKKQLEHAICGVYGSDKIDAKEYLRRFIDIEFVLPDPNPENFCNYLYEYFEFDDFFLSSKRINHSAFAGDRGRFIEFTYALFKTKKATLRLQEKIFTHTRIALNAFQSNQYIFPRLFFFLVYLKNCYPDIYNDIREGILSYQSIIDKIESIFKEISSKNAEELLFVEAYLIRFYSNSFNNANNISVPLIKDSSADKIELVIKSNIDIKEANSILANYVQHISRNIDIHGLGIDFLLKKIDLTEPQII